MDDLFGEDEDIKMDGLPYSTVFPVIADTPYAAAENPHKTRKLDELRTSSAHRYENQAIVPMSDQLTALETDIMVCERMHSHCDSRWQGSGYILPSPVICRSPAPD